VTIACSPRFSAPSSSWGRTTGIHLLLTVTDAGNGAQPHLPRPTVSSTMAREARTEEASHQHQYGSPSLAGVTSASIRIAITRLHLRIDLGSRTCTTSPLSRANPARPYLPSPPARLCPASFLARCPVLIYHAARACPRGWEGAVVGVLWYGMAPAGEIHEE
jgi:hypothetical protein